MSSTIRLLLQFLGEGVVLHLKMFLLVKVPAFAGKRILLLLRLFVLDFPDFIFLAPLHFFRLDVTLESKTLSKPPQGGRLVLLLFVLLDVPLGLVVKRIFP